MSSSSSYPKGALSSPRKLSSRFSPISSQKLKQTHVPQSRNPTHLINFHKLWQQEGVKHISFINTCFSINYHSNVSLYVKKKSFNKKLKKYRKYKENISKDNTSFFHLTCCKHFSFS